MGVQRAEPVYTRKDDIFRRLRLALPARKQRVVTIQRGLRKLQALPSAGLSLDDYSAQLFEVWFPVGEEALDNNQEATPIPEHLAKALDVALAGFLELEKTTYENL